VVTTIQERFHDRLLAQRDVLPHGSQARFRFIGHFGRLISETAATHIGRPTSAKNLTFSCPLRPDASICKVTAVTGIAALTANARATAASAAEGPR